MSTNRVHNGESTNPDAPTRSTLLETIDRSFSNVIHRQQTDTSKIIHGIDAVRSSIKDVIVQKYPDGVLQSAIGGSLQAAIQEAATGSLPPEGAGRGEPLYMELRRVCSEIFSEMTQNVSGLFHTIDRSRNGQESDHSFGISKDALMQIMKDLLAEEGNMAVAPCDDTNALRIHERARAKMLDKAHDLFNALPDTIDVAKFGEFQREHEKLFTTIVAPTLPACGIRAEQQIRAQFYLLHTKCGEKVTKHFLAQQQSKEVKKRPEITIPLPVLTEIFTWYGTIVGQSDEFREQVGQAVKEDAGIRNLLEKITKDRKQIWLKASKNLPSKNPTEAACLKFIAEIEGAMVKDSQEIVLLNRGFGGTCVQNSIRQCKLWREEVQEWFANQRKRPDVQPNEVRMPFDVFDSFWSELRDELGKIKGDIQDTVRTLGAKQLRKVQKESDRHKASVERKRRSIMGTELTEQECIVYIESVNAESDTFLTGSDRQFKQMKEVSSKAQKIGAEKWMKKVKEWFALHNKKEAREQAPARMTESVLRGISENAIAMHQIKGPMKDAIMDKAKTMPDHIKIKIGDRLRDVSSTQTEIIPSEFTKDEFLEFWPRLSKLGEYTEEPWKLSYPEIYEVMHATTIASNEQVQRDVLAWFAAQNGDKETEEVTVTRNEIDRILQSHPRPSLTLTTIGGKSEQAEKVMEELIEVNNAIFLALPEVMDKQRLEVYLQQKRVNLIVYLTKMELLLQKESFQELQVAMIEFSDNTDAEMLALFSIKQKTVSLQEIDNVYYYNIIPEFELIALAGKGPDVTRVIRLMEDGFQSLFNALPENVTEEELIRFQKQRREYLVTYLIALKGLLNEESYHTFEQTYLAYTDKTEKEGRALYRENNEADARTLSKSRLKSILTKHDRSEPTLPVMTLTGKVGEMERVKKELIVMNTNLMQQLPEEFTRKRWIQYEQEQRAEVLKCFGEMKKLLEPESYNRMTKIMLEYHQNVHMEIRAYFDANSTSNTETTLVTVNHAEIDAILTAEPKPKLQIRVNAADRRANNLLKEMTEKHQAFIEALPEQVTEEAWSQCYENRIKNLDHYFSLLEPHLEKKMFDEMVQAMLVHTNERATRVRMLFEERKNAALEAGPVCIDKQTLRSIIDPIVAQGMQLYGANVPVLAGTVTQVQELFAQLAKQNGLLFNALPDPITEQVFAKYYDDTYFNVLQCLVRIKQYFDPAIFDAFKIDLVDVHAQQKDAVQAWFNAHRSPVSAERQYTGLIPKVIMQQIWSNTKDDLAKNDPGAESALRKLQTIMDEKLRRDIITSEDEIDRHFNQMPALVSWEAFLRYTEESKRLQAVGFQRVKTKNPKLWGEVENQIEREFVANIENIRKWFEQNEIDRRNAGVGRGVEHGFNIGSPDGEPLTVISRNEFSSISSQFRTIFRTEIPEVPGLDIKSMIREQNLREREIFAELPDVIDDYMILVEYYRKCIDLFTSFLRQISEAGHPDLCQGPRDMFFTGQMEIQRAIRRSCALPNTPVDPDGKATAMSSWELTALRIMTFKEHERKTYKMTQAHANEFAREKSKVETDGKIEFQCPDYFDEFWVVEKYIEMMNKGHVRLLPIIQKACTSEEATRYSKEFEEGKQRFMDEFYKNYALKKTLDLSSLKTNLRKDDFHGLLLLIQKNNPTGIEPLGEDDDALRDAVELFSKEDAELWKTLPAVIDDYNVIIPFHIKSIGIFDRLYQEILHSKGAQYAKRVRRTFLNNILTTERALRSGYNLQNSGVVEGRYTALPTWEMNQIINENMTVHRVRFTASTNDQNAEIEAAMLEWERQLTEKLRTLPSVIRHYSDVQTVMNELIGLQNRMVDFAHRYCDAQKLATVENNLSKVLSLIHAEIHRFYLLPGMTESGDKKKSITRDRLHEIAREVWDKSPLQLTMSEQQKEFFDRFRTEYSKLQKERFAALPEVITDWSTIIQFHKDTIELARDRMVPKIKTFIGVQQALNWEHHFRTGLRQTEIGIHELYALSGKSPYGNVSTNEADSLPDILTKEWIIQEIVDASLRADREINAPGDAGLRRLLENVTSNLDDTLKDADARDIAGLVYWLTGKVEGIDSLIPTGYAPQIPAQRGVNLTSFNKAIGRIVGVLRKNPNTIIPEAPYLPGIKNWPAYEMDGFILATRDQIAVEIIHAVNDGIRRFIAKNRARLLTEYKIKTDVWPNLMRDFESSLMDFLQRCCPEDIRSESTVQGIGGFLNECTAGISQYLAAMGLPRGEALAVTLDQNIKRRCSDVCEKYVEIFRKEHEKRVKEFTKKRSNTSSDAAHTVYPPPAIVRGPLPQKESRTAGVETFWNAVISRTITRLTSSFVQHCNEQGVIFPSQKKADIAQAMLRHMFRTLEQQCSAAVAKIIRTSNIAPTASELNDAIMDTVMNFSVPSDCPKELQTAFDATIRDGLFEMIADNALLSNDLRILHNPHATWDRELAPLFKAKESLPAKDRTEMHTMLNPLKQKFATRMIRNMIGAVERKETGAGSYVVHEKGFSSRWIPIIQSAIATQVDLYADQQPSGSATIADFLDKHFSSIRQRTLFTRIGSAAAGKLSALGSAAPTERLVAAMRSPIDTIAADDFHDEDDVPLETFVQSELLGMRDATLLPEERSTLQQFCKNIASSGNEILTDATIRRSALQGLADQCNKNYHAGFTFRTAAHFEEIFQEMIGDILKEGEKASEPAVAEADKHLPPQALELLRACELNAEWIAEWRAQGPKKEAELAGFLQQVLHWHEIATTFIARCRITGKMNGHFEEARLAAETVTMVRTKNILKVSAPKLTNTGKQTKGGVTIAKRKIHSLLEWKRTRDQLLQSGSSAPTEMGLHVNVVSSLTVITQIGAEMQLLAAELLHETDHSATIAALSVKLKDHERSLESSLQEQQELSGALSELAEWRNGAEEMGRELLSGIRFFLSNVERHCSSNEAQMSALQANMKAAQEKITKYTIAGGADGNILSNLSDAFNEAERALHTIEEEMMATAYPNRDTLNALSKEIASFLAEIGGNTGTESTETSADFESICRDASAFINQAKEWQFYNAEQIKAAQKIQTVQHNMGKDREEHEKLGAEHTGSSENRSRYEQLEKILQQVNAAMRTYLPPKK